MKIKEKIDEFNIKLMRIMKANDELWTITSKALLDETVSLATNALLSSIIQTCMMNDSYIKTLRKELSRLKGAL